VDTGPLVAICSKQDQHHAKCLSVLEHLPGPLFSCWPVLTEAAWLLRRFPSAVEALLRGVTAGFIELLPLSAADVDGIAAVMRKYDLEPQLADAALVHLASREGIDTIFTLDHRDFGIYRSAKNRKFRIVPERL
jgi:predicted nucleic acid-binding protein